MLQSFFYACAQHELQTMLCPCDWSRGEELLDGFQARYDSCSQTDTPVKAG